MNIYLLMQSERTWYDNYDSCVVCAESEEDARRIHPSDDEWNGEDDGTWPHHSFVSVTLVGLAKEDLEKGCILASFNAG